MPNTTRRALLGATSALILPTFLASAPKEGWAAQDNLEFGLLGFVSNLDPHVNSGNSWNYITSVIYSRLVTWNAKNEMIPQLATSWTLPDSKTLIFKLRSDVIFHKGQKFTAHDVVYSLERITNPATGASLGSTIGKLRATATNDYEVRIDLEQPDAGFITTLAMPDASILSKDWMAGSPNIRADANGTGPYVFTSIEPGVGLKAARNTAYFGRKAHIATIDFKLIANDSARLNALRSGVVDIIDYVPWNQIDQVKAEKSFDVHAGLSALMNLWLNPSRPALKDVRVRQALAFAIDRDAISKATFFGYGEPALGPPTPPSSTFFHPDLSHHYKLDIAKAQTLLKEAALPSDTTLDFIVSQNPGAYVTVAQIVQANLAKIGVKMNIKLVDWPTLLSHKNSGDYDAMVYGTSIPGLDPVNTLGYFFGSNGGLWSHGADFNDGEINTLLASARSELDPAKRGDIYHALEMRILDVCPWIFLCWRKDAYALKRSIRGFTLLEGARFSATCGVSLPDMTVGA